MNGLIPKRSCVNPVLITTFGLEPPGTKKMRVKECRPWSEATERGFGKPWVRGKTLCIKHRFSVV